MQNELLFIGTTVLTLASVLMFYRFFGKTGLYVCATFLTLMGNIAVCKCVILFGMEATGGNVLFASAFLVTDILSEKYGKKEANRSVAYTFTAMLCWLIGTQVILQFVPSAEDMAQESLQNIFGVLPRISLASLTAFLVSQWLDVSVYHAVWQKTGGGEKRLWLRNNVGTLTAQAVDTLIFTSVAFLGRYPAPVFFEIMLTTYLFKAFIALIDTPFIYLARRISPREE